METHVAPRNVLTPLLLAADVASMTDRPERGDDSLTVESTATVDFDAFYRAEHASIARALAMTLGDGELAADATNEAMTRAIQRWDAVSTYENPAGWVYRVGLNWARSWLRRRKRERDRPITFGPGTTTFEIEDDGLSDALQTLSVNHRAVVICRLYLDWSVDETSRALKVPPGTVKSRLARALDHLRGELEQADASETETR